MIYNKLELPYLLHPIDKNRVYGYRIMFIKPFFGHYDIYTNNEIANVWIDPQFRNLGYSKILLNHALENNKNIWLWVELTNTHAINCYKKNNFIFSNITKNKIYAKMIYTIN